MQAAPQPTDDYDEASRMEYVDKAYRTFRDFRSDFASIEHDFGFGPYVSDATNAFFTRGATDFTLSSYGPGVVDQMQADQIWVEYNIPKLCNVDMIKVLPGLSGYTQNGARGGFFADRNELGTKVAEFIGRVPTDSDMFKPGGILYSRN